MADELLFIQCGMGLEDALDGEVRALGLEPAIEPGGCEVRGPPGTYELANLWLRSANRVLLRVGEASDVDALGKLPMRRYLAPNAAVKLNVSGEHPGKWGDAANARWCGGALVEGAAPLEVYLRVKHGRCSVSLDTSGELLHFRGYRQEVGAAPMRETLAAGVLLLSRWAAPEPLWDVMCGSGTVVIEAAELAAGLAAGRNRAFAFEHFPSHDAARWKARSRARDAVRAPIFASDLNAGALGTARRNARRAGVGESLTLERFDATALAVRPGVAPGLVVANLPYGKRVGERSELGRLYRALGQSVRRACAGWRYAFLLEEGAEHLGLPVDDRFRVGNGGLSCELVTGRIG